MLTSIQQCLCLAQRQLAVEHDRLALLQLTFFIKPLGLFRFNGLFAPRQFLFFFVQIVLTIRE